MPTQFERGSEWRRWDLHVHTPASFENAFEGWDSYLEALRAVRGVSVLGVTDYFFIDGYRKIRELRESGDLANFDLILPNVELRLGTFIPKRGDGTQLRRLNFHVIFSNELTPDIIEQQFIQALHFQIDGNPEGEPGSRNLTRAAVEEAGRLVKKFQQNFAGDSDFVAGCKVITVELDEARKVLQKDCFTGKYLLLLAAENWDQIDWNQDYLVRRSLLQKAHGLFAGQKRTADWCLGRGDISAEAFIREFGTLKPCVHGSDAHRIDAICKPADDKNCWIKADPTFEGLKQIVFEPAERIRIQPTTPANEHPRLFIDGLQVDESNNFLIPNGAGMSFSHELVAVIGGRGSGKSALAEGIAYVFGKHATKSLNEKDPFIPFFQRAGADCRLKLKLGDRDGNIAEFSRTLSDPGEPSAFPLTYLGQNKIEEFATNDAKVHGLISETILSSSALYSQHKELEEKTGAIQTGLVTLLSQIYAKEKVGSEINVADLRRQKKQLEEEHRLLSSKETREVLEKLNTLRDRKTELSDLREQIAGLKSFMEDASLEIIARYDALRARASELALPLPEAVPDFSAPAKALAALDANPIFAQVDKEMAAAEEEVRNALRGKVDVSIERINYLTDEIAKIDKKLKEAADIETALKELRKQRDDKFRELLATYEQLRDSYAKIIEQFLSKDVARGILRGVSFEPELYFKRAELVRHLFDNYVDKRRCKTIDTLGKGLNFETAAEFIQWVINNLDKEDPFLVFNEAARNKVKSDLFQNHFELRTKVSFEVDGQKIPLAQLSLGLKGTVVLKLFLATTSSPILLDQPEDHLDNQFIATALVETFREAKKTRQVIIITHNANLVVNGDAEQVIVAEFKAGRLSYKSGSLENPEIRAKATDLLEGGVDAFRQRERRYGLS